MVQKLVDLVESVMQEPIGRVASATSELADTEGFVQILVLVTILRLSIQVLQVDQ